MIKEQLKIFLTAVMFYTRIPCPSYVDHSEEYLNKSTRHFPLIGIIVGFISFIVFWISNLIFNIEISIVFSIAAGILITGAFHEDGLADTFDGFGGAFEAKKKTDWRLKPGMIKAKFGNPIHFSKYSNLSVEELRDFVKSKIQILLK